MLDLQDHAPVRALCREICLTRQLSRLGREREFDMQHTTPITWRDYADRLAPEEIAILERGDANPNHPGGPEGHRRGHIAVAQMYIAERRSRLPWWRRWMPT